MSRPGSIFATVGLCLLAVIGVELSLRGLFFIRDDVSIATEETAADPLHTSPVYEDAGFDPYRLWDELQQSTNTWLRYQPYTVWTRGPYAGTYVNVNLNGRRVTTDNSDLPDAMRIWVLGGSTAWGIGVPDAHTLPSYLARKLDRAGIAAHVVNFGQPGFVSTQDLFTLIRALQTQPLPDLVIFYEGANEGIGLLDAPEQINPHYLTKRIAGLYEGRPENRSPAMELLQRTALYRLATGIGNRLFARPSKTVVPAHLTDHEKISELAADGIQAYLTNQMISTAMAHEAGFKVVFFWQPMLGVGKKPLDQYEQSILEELLGYPREKFLIEFALEQTRQLEALHKDLTTPAGLRFIDITNVFEETIIPVYLDWVHIGPRGNEILAETMLRHLRPEICELAIERHRDPVPAFCGD